MFKMTPNVLRNLLSHKATRRYPYETRTPFETVRGELCNDVNNCTFCGICSVKCPSQCITVDKKAATWTCDPFACVFCGICTEVCPARCLQQKKAYRFPVYNREVIHMQGKARQKKGNE